MGGDDPNVDQPEALEELDAEEAKVQSKKIEVIEILFAKIWPEGTTPTGPLIATNDLVVDAINERNAKHPEETKGLSTSNPANFLKDFIRKRTCNNNWPSELKKKRMTARQRYGDKQVMEFVPYREGDEVPFPDRFDPIADMQVLPFESLSIPVEARALGRSDEPWLIQVIVGQRLLNTHMAVVARNQGLDVETLTHLQMSVKTQPEIDATFIATIKQGDQRLRAYVTGEAKQFNERILEDQIREQVAKAFEITEALSGVDAIDAVIPTVFQVVRYPTDTQTVKSRQGIYVLQFDLIPRDKFDEYSGDRLHELSLQVQSRAFYEAKPPILGISSNPPKKKRKPKPKPTKRKSKTTEA